MAKQTFTTGQVLTAAQVNALQTNDFNQTVDTKTASYVLVVGDRGNRIEFNTSGSVTCTVNTGIFSAGDTVMIQNRGAGVVTITAGTATVNTAGSLAVAQWEGGVLYFISASAAIWFEYATPQTGDITAVTTAANSGLTGGATSGDVALRLNTTAKGSLIVGTGATTLGELTVGTNGHTIVADSSTSTGLKWAAPGGGGSFTLIARTSFTNVASQSFDNFSSTYETYMVVIEKLWNVDQNDADLRLTMRYSTTDGTAHYGGATKNAYNAATWTNTSTAINSNYVTISTDCGVSTNPNMGVIYFINGFENANQDAQFFGTYIDVNNGAQTMFFGINLSNQQYTGSKLAASTQNIYGTAAIYGLAKS